MKIRIKDIADRAGVSTGTVDRVIHERGEVSSKTRDRVLGILKEMHYEPDILASSLASRRPFRAAVLVPFHTPENWFWKEPLTGIIDACNELNHFRIEVKEFLYDQFNKEEFLEKSGEALEFTPDAVIAASIGPISAMAVNSDDLSISVSSSVRKASSEIIIITKNNPIRPRLLNFSFIIAVFDKSLSIVRSFCYNYRT